ncbi:MAG: helix-turn-helix transcriptional regulator [Treponema sp.]|jgi:transcriptional regulator with XRE-family HTH domain|nr:helix-turn-helix transcriptional regulator [Treponema sp.]
MGLKHIFVRNLKKVRISKGISQMKLAEICNTTPNYIAAIEIGRRFPSLKLIEKIGNALNIEPYRFFIDETGAHKGEFDEMVNLLSKLPEEQRLSIINKISAQ